MGHSQDTQECNPSARKCRVATLRLGWRTCLRKGCGRRYRARQWNQRYCQDPECLRLVRRWQATKRQRQRRARPEARQQHAQAERARREQGRARSRPPAGEDVVSVDTALSSGAWSRSEAALPRVLCNRPGCYEPPRDGWRAPSFYCSDACRQAVRRAKDRERKYLARKTKVGRFKRRLEYWAAAKKQSSLSSTRQGPLDFDLQPVDGRARTAVGGYGQPGETRVPLPRSVNRGPPRSYQS
jgi:hypothetical protein